jgi:hypothetical protein
MAKLMSEPARAKLEEGAAGGCDPVAKGLIVVAASETLRGGGFVWGEGRQGRYARR